MKNGFWQRVIDFIIEDHPYITLTLFSALIMLPLLGSYPLLGQWEPHYGRVAMEMMASNRWDWFLDPIYLGRYDFWSKPIFAFWMVFPFMKVLGPTELALRLPFALNGIAGILMIYYLTKRMFNDKTRAFLAALFALLFPIYTLISKQFMWDITTVTLSFSATLLLFVGMRDNKKKDIRIAYALMGIVMLTKGLLAILIPGGAFFLWFIVNGFVLSQKDEKISFMQSILADIKRLRILEGLGIFIAVAGWWYLYMYIRHGSPFFIEFFGKHHFGRLEGAIKKPDGPFDYYIWQYSMALFPWIAFAPAAMYRAAIAKKKEKEEQFILLTILFLTLFFSLSATKFPHYIFPAIPFIAMIMPPLFINFIKGKQLKSWYVIAIISALLVGLVAKDLGTGLNYREMLYFITTHRVQKWFGRVYDMVPYLEIVTPIFVLFVLLPLISIKRKVLRIISVSGMFSLSLLFIGYLNFYWVPQMLEVFTPKKLVKIYQQNKQPGDIIIDYNNWKNRSMYFYLGVNEHLYRETSTAAIKKLIEERPNNTIYITVKDKHVPELRSALLNDLGAPLIKIADDSVPPYKEIELYKTGVNIKAKGMDDWKKSLISEKSIPRNITKIDGTFAQKSVKIIGYKLNKGSYDPKEKVILDVYYKVLKPIEENYKFFFHFDVYSGALPFSFKIDEYPLKGYYPTTKWQVGDIIHEHFEEVVPPSHPGGGIKIYTGLYKGNTRLGVDQEKYNDGENRFILGTFRVNIR
ncbi:glycosyltransferase family 39 protein [bacterium]|nr:glycosyltransferase family 39 protein [bacterium]